jgi:hypothetical protein
MVVLGGKQRQADQNAPSPGPLCATAGDPSLAASAKPLAARKWGEKIDREMPAQKPSAFIIAGKTNQHLINSTHQYCLILEEVMIQFLLVSFVFIINSRYAINHLVWSMSTASMTYVNTRHAQISRIHDALISKRPVLPYSQPPSSLSASIRPGDLDDYD